MRNRLTNDLSDVRQSAEIDGLYANSILRKRSSLELGWNGFVIERRVFGVGEVEEAVADVCHVILWDRHISYGERAELRNGRFTPFQKEPGMLSLSPAGVLPAGRFFTRSEVIVCAFRAAWMKEIRAELDVQPTGSPYEQLGIHDPGLQKLLSLLASECAAGGPNGLLYAESLAHAAAIRFLHLVRETASSHSNAESPLPPHLVTRTVEYMRANFHLNPDLATLASESGYSRAHFLRMFRVATGKTPHQFLLELRLEEARKRLADVKLPLSNIAIACGFSSQSHFSHIFMRTFGVAPGEYRRKI